MSKNTKELLEETEKLSKENKELLQQLRDAKEYIEAIKTGNIDALVIHGEKELKIYTEKTSDKTYRILIEKMHEGAVTLNESGIILYCNSRFANMVTLPLQKVIGAKFKDFIDNSSKERFDYIFKEGWDHNVKEEIYLCTNEAEVTPVLMSVTALSLDNSFILSIILTDLTVQKKNQEDLRLQKELLEKAEQIADIGSWVVDIQTNKVTLSNELYRIYGLDPVKNSISLSPLELIHQNNLAVSKMIFETAVKSLSSFDTYTRINIPPDNREKTLHVKGNVITKDGKAFQLIGTSQDVTTIMKTEQDLKEYNKQLIAARKKIIKLNEGLESTVEERTKELKLSRQHFKFLTDHIPQMAWTANADGTIDYYNSKWYEYTGMPFAKAGWETILLPDDWPKVDSQWKKSVKTGHVLETECRIKCNLDDKYRWHLCRALPFKDETGKTVKWFGTCTDIEEQKKAIEQKDEFIGIASHELRSPITSLKGYNQLIELMLNKNNTRDAKEYIKKSAEIIEILNSLVTELHEVTKIQAGKFQLDKTEFNFGEFLDSSIQSIQISNNTHQISKTGEVNITILADKQRLQQVLFNYLTNAIKYSPNSDRVIVEVNLTKNLLTVAVKDFGLGIPENEISNIFTRFFRASSTKYIEGLGLGLYLCKQIIKAHKGQVWVESKEGKGSTFYFSLPIL